MRRLILFLAILLISASLFAQERSSKKAADAYREALSSYHLSQYERASKYARQSLKHDPEYTQAYLLLADVYFKQGKREETISILNDLLALNLPVECYVYLMLAKTEHEIGAYEAMKEHLGIYESCDGKEETDAWEYDLLKKSNEFALHAIKNPVNFEPVNLGEAINTEYPEYLPGMTIDGETLLFTRRIPVDKANPQSTLQEDFFQSHWVDSVWTVATPLGHPINTQYNEGAATISADGRILIFTGCSAFGNKYGMDRKGYGSCDLFYSMRKGDHWSAPENLGTNINSVLWESQPSISADGQTLYFIRADQSKSNSGDIYVSKLQPTNSWGKPKKLPDNINSRGKESSVFIHPDGKTLYFSSNGHPGMGRFDIFKATKLTDSTWTDPVNLGYPINTHNDENSIMVSPDGRYAYFASEREEGFGKMDLYRFEMPVALRPAPVSYMRGKVFDKETLKPLQARFQLIDLETGTLVITAYSDIVDGTFLTALPPGKNYLLNVFAPDYLFYSDNFQMQENRTALKPFIKEIPLQRIAVGESVVLRNVFFDFSKSDLKRESEIELMKLIDFLQKNPTVHIELEGHADSEGNEAYNLKLSEARAKVVRDYLTLGGIAPQRLSFKGYGSSRPVETNETKEGQAANRRTEFRITKE